MDSINKTAGKFAGAVAIVKPLRRGLLLFSLLASGSLFGLVRGNHAIDPNLQVDITKTNQSIVLRWFGSNTMSYQVETSFTMTNWSDSGPVLNGANAFIYSTNPVAVGANSFFRVKRFGNGNITAEFDISAGVLKIYGDQLDNSITVSRTAAGALVVNGGAVTISGGVPTVANTYLVQVFAGDGNDQVALNEINGALPNAELFGEDGNDTLTGGAGGDFISGGIGSDTLLGKGGADTLIGGGGDDILIGGDGDDSAFGDDGNDRFVWNPGDDNDINEGDLGDDIAEVNGGNGAESFTATANGTRVRFDRVNPAPFSLDIGSCERLVLNANGGDDSFSATGNLAALISITVDGGTGADTLLGSNGIDLLLGGDGNDFIDGQQGNDVVFMGAGNDVFQWDPGDGSDTIEGQADTDTLRFNCSAVSEILNLATNGIRVRFTRDIGAIVMDFDDIEILEVDTLAGADTLTINTLGTDIGTVTVNLASTLGGSFGDGASDAVIVNGTAGPDAVNVFGSDTSYYVAGLNAAVFVNGSEGANDSLVVNTLEGEDSFTAATLPSGIVKLTADGGMGNDTLIGSAGADILIGGDNDDSIRGLQGNDLALMGSGNDTFEWEPGDGSDIVEGQAGTDSLFFAGSNGSENIDIVANGGRMVLSRNVGSVMMDLDDVENIQCRPFGGVDNISIGDLTGTDAASIMLGLAGSDNAGDAASDTITINGSQVADSITVAGNTAAATVSGLKAIVGITGHEQANDRLVLNGQGGNDVVDATWLTSGTIQFTINGGLGDDVLLGSPGQDFVNGGDGNDTVLLGAGDDTFVWNPGDDNDVLEGQAGADTLLFNGANVAENINISANGGRVRFFRDIASVVTDMNDVESVLYKALGGADNIVINDLTGTDLTDANIDLAGTTGSGDGAADTITVNGTAAADSISLAVDAGAVKVSGLSANVRITQPELAIDRVIVNGLGGVDTFTVGAGVTTLIGVTLNQ